MIPIRCNDCDWPNDCESNASIHVHRCPKCGRCKWLTGSPLLDFPSHTRTLLRGNCYQLGKV